LWFNFVSASDFFCVCVGWGCNKKSKRKFLIYVALCLLVVHVCDTHIRKCLHVCERYMIAKLKFEFGFFWRQVLRRQSTNGSVWCRRWGDMTQLCLLSFSASSLEINLYYICIYKHKSYSIFSDVSFPKNNNTLGQ